VSRAPAHIQRDGGRYEINPLSSDEEIALRRIAHGSKVDPGVAARLQDLALIQRTNGGYRLTPLGQLRHDALPKAPLLTCPRTINALTNYVVGRIDKAQSDARVRASARSEASIATRQDLEQEILSLIQIIETDQAAMRLPTISKADKAQLLRAVDHRRARLAILQEHLAALLRPNADSTGTKAERFDRDCSA